MAGISGWFDQLLNGEESGNPGKGSARKLSPNARIETGHTEREDSVLGQVDTHDLSGQIVVADGDEVSVGVRIGLSGRLGGADMARKEEHKRGRIPLQTLRADVDFARARAKIPQGDIGIKVWIYRGDIFEDEQEK